MVKGMQTKTLSNNQKASLQLLLFLALALLASLLVNAFEEESQETPVKLQSGQAIKGQAVSPFDPTQVLTGYHLLYPPRPKAFLLNLEGEIVHSWDFHKLPEIADRRVPLFHVEPLPDSSVLATFKDYGIARVAWNGRKIWFQKGRYHHDSALNEKEEVLVLARGRAPFSAKGVESEALADFVHVISPEGELLQEHNLLDLFAPHIEKAKLLRAKEFAEARNFGPKVFKNDRPTDLLHTNSLDIIEYPIPDIAEEGDIILSFRAQNMLGITDPEFSEVKWTLKKHLSWQHDATVTRDGKILVLDNGRSQKRSRALKIDPKSKEIVWSYGDKADERFYTEKRGGAQELPNGHVLITQTYPITTLFEVNREGRVLWKGVNMKSIVGKECYRSMRLLSGDEFLRRIL